MKTWNKKTTYHKCIQIKHNQRLTCQRTIWVLPLARDILINPSLFAFQNKLISKDLSFSDLLRITPKKPPHGDFTDFRDPLRLHAFPFILSNLGRSSWYDPDCSFTSFCKLQRHFVGSLGWRFLTTNVSAISWEKAAYHLNYWAPNTPNLAEGRPGKGWTVNKHSQFH